MALNMKAVIFEEGFLAGMRFAEEVLYGIDEKPVNPYLEEDAE